MHTSTKWLVLEIAVVVLVVGMLGILGHPAILPYQWHRFLHILGGVLLLGNIMVTAAWAVLAGRSKSAAVARFAAEAINWADVFFTVPGIFLLITNGDILAEAWGGVFKTGWITGGLALFLASGLLWGAFLIPYQARLIRLSRDASSGEPTREFTRLLRRWFIIGGAATVLPALSLALMVFKPAF